MPDFLTLPDFTPHEGGTFRLPDVPGVELVLSKARLLSHMKKGGRPLSGEPREPFDLIFLGPLTPVLPQQIYRMETEGMDELEIFIVPLGPVEGGMTYQAVFT